MSFIIGNEYILLPLFGILVFVIVYLSSDRIIAFSMRRTANTREDVLRMLDLMFVETDKKKISALLMLASLGFGLLMFLLLWPHFIPGFLFGVSATFVGWQLPKTIVGMVWERRCTKVVDQLVDGLTIMANGVRAGLSLTQSMERVVQNLRGPLSQELALILNKVQLGMAVEDALNEFADRVPRQDVQMLVTSVNILKETGGNLAETFSTIVTVVRERQKVEKRIQAMTAQGTMQAIIISIVPFVLLGIFLVLDPQYIEPLFTRPLGWFALALMLALQVIGGYIMKKIVTIKV